MANISNTYGADFLTNYSANWPETNDQARYAQMVQERMRDRMGAMASFNVPKWTWNSDAGGLEPKPREPHEFPVAKAA